MKKLILTLLIGLFAGFVSGKEYFDKDGVPVKPSPERLVNIVPPSANPFTAAQVNSLEKELVQFSNETSTQIALVVVDDLHGWDKAQLAVEIGHSWGIGQKEKDNGIVILLKPKTSSRGEVFIATGYGLEGVIPDAVAKRIVEFEMIPQFKKGDYYSGISNSISVLKGLALEEFAASDYVKKRQGSSPGWIGLIPILIFIFFFIALRRAGGRTYGSSSNAFWTAYFLGSAMGGRRSSGGWGDFSSGGGGFGGFGGGGFGGGGAGGSW